MNAPPPPTRKSSYTPILVTILASFLLGGASCFGFLTTINMHGDSPINNAFAIGFLICMVAFLGSVLWLGIKAIRNNVRSR